MGDVLGLVAVILAILLCMYCANRLAKWKGWDPLGWMLATLLLGPLPLILMLLLPGKRKLGTLPEGENGSRQ